MGTSARRGRGGEVRGRGRGGDSKEGGTGKSRRPIWLLLITRMPGSWVVLRAFVFPRECSSLGFALHWRQPLPGKLGREDPLHGWGNRGSQKGFITWQEVDARSETCLKGLFTKVWAGLGEPMVENPEGNKDREIIANFRPTGTGDIQISTVTRKSHNL